MINDLMKLISLKTQQNIKSENKSKSENKVSFI